MTEHINHRAEAGSALEDLMAIGVNPNSPLAITQLGLLHGILALHDLIAEVAEDDLDAEEQHQSEKFEATPLVSHADADTVESPRFAAGGFQGGGIIPDFNDGIPNGAA